MCRRAVDLSSFISTRSQLGHSIFASIAVDAPRFTHRAVVGLVDELDVDQLHPQRNTPRHPSPFMIFSRRQFELWWVERRQS